MGFKRAFVSFLTAAWIGLGPTTPSAFALKNPSRCNELATGAGLLASLDHPDIPWGKFTLQDLIPALEKAIADYKIRLDAIAGSPRIPSAENTFLAEEEAAEAISKIQAVFWNETLSNSSPEVHALEGRFTELIADWFQYRSSHPGFLARAKILGEPVFERFNRPVKGVELSPMDQYVFSVYSGLRQGGAWVPSSKKQQLASLYRRLARAQSDFVKNVMKTRESIRIRVRNVKELEGLSPEAIERARSYGEAEGIYLIPVSDKLLVSEIQHHAKSRALRRKLWYARTPKEVASKFITAKEAGDAWSHSNEQLIREISALNREYAAILGHPHYAAYQLESQMINGAKGVERFFDEFIPRVLRSAREERRQLEKFARKLDRIDRLEEWDVPYYSRMLMKETWGFDYEDLSEYFEINQTIRNMLTYAEKRFPIRFELKDGADSYHSGNSVYEVFDTRSNKKISEIHLDPYRREGKQFFQGWEYLFRARGVGSQGELPAVMSVSMNIEPSKNGKPVLLGFESGVQLAFHEFVGHALHESSDISKIPGIAGTQGVFEDGVETPSMIAEEFARDPLFLKMATHHKTGKPLPARWINIISKELPKFQRGLDLLAGTRMLSKAYLDFHYGLDPPKPGQSSIEWEKEKLGKLNLFPASPYAPMGHEFLHHFGGGMECLYFSYITGAVKGAFVADFLFRQEYNQPMKFMNYWDHVLAPSGQVSDINFLIEQFTGEGITLHPYFQRYGF